MDDLQLFIFTVKEYKRFVTQIKKHHITDEYNEASYTETNTKLMLLRKYGNFNENVYIEKIIKEATTKFIDKKEELNNILDEFHKIENQQFEYILEDGTKLNLYQTIEDVMYGMYLHADENRINRLLKTKESLRFACVRKYVEELEKIVLKTYDCLKNYGDRLKKERKFNRASIIYLGDKMENKQEIEKSPYWKNLYGKDGTGNDLEEIIKKENIEDLVILTKCLIFLDELQKDNISLNTIDSLIFPTTKKDWGDYTEAQKFYKSIKSPGISSKVRYNENHTMAYVRIFPQVDNTFIISTPHVIDELYEICLVRENINNEWKIYVFGGHLESYIIKK